jgi:hypothetical protein
LREQVKMLLGEDVRMGSIEVLGNDAAEGE